MSVYLDASAILPIFIGEGASLVVERYLSELSDDVMVSEFAAAEVAAAFSRLGRTGALTTGLADQGLSDFDAWRAAMTRDVDVQPSDVRLTSVFVRRFDLMLRAPDALHVAICRRADYLLVTLDRRLALAASELGVRTRLLTA